MEAEQVFTVFRHCLENSKALQIELASVLVLRNTIFCSFPGF